MTTPIIRPADNAAMTWVRICTLDQVPGNKAIGFTVNGQRMIVARCNDNNAQILQGLCSHMGVPLANAKVNNCEVTCWLHHSTFNVTDGTVVAWSTFPPVVGPALAAIRKQNALKTFETRVDDEGVWLLWPNKSDSAIDVQITL